MLLPVLLCRSLCGHMFISSGWMPRSRTAESFDNSDIFEEASKHLGDFFVNKISAWLP